MENSPALNNKEKIFVLHVDDEEDFLVLTKEYVESATEGEIIFEYLSKPQDIFDKLKEKQYDVIVCDYLMPEMDGLDLLSQLKEKNYDIPFIIFTGRSREEVVIEALNLGANYYIKKGVDTKSQYTELIHHINTIVEHKRASLALKETEEKFSLFMQNLPAIAYMKEADGTIVFSNEYSIDNYGLELTVGKNTEDIFGPEVGIIVEEEDKLTLAQGPQIFQGERIINDEKRIFRAYKFPIEREGKNTLVGGVSIDITDQQEAELALQESEEKFSLFMDNLPAIAFIKDEDGKVIYINRFMIEKYGADDVKGKLSKELFPADLAEDKEFEDQAIIKEDRTVITETAVQRDGIDRIFQTYKFPIKRKNKPPLIGGVGIDITELEKAKEELTEREELLSSFMEQIPSVAYIKDKESRYVHVSAYLSKQFAREDLVGKSVGDFLSPEETERVVKEDQEILEKGSQLVTRTERKMGDENLIFQTYKFPINIKGEMMYVGGISLDITEREKALMALKKSQIELQIEKDRIQQYLDNAGVIFVILNTDGTTEFINKKLTEILGYKEEDLIGKNWFDIIYPKNIVDEIKFTFQQVVAGITEPAEYLEIVVKTKKGREKTLAFRGITIKDDDDKIVQILASAEDITERKEMERALQESEERYRKLIDTSPDSIILSDLSGNIILANERAAEMHGYGKAEELIGTSIIELTSIEDRDKILESFRNSDISSEEGALEYTLLRKDGSSFPVELSSSIILDNEGIPIAVMGVGRDISERKKSELEIIESEEKYRMLFDIANDIVLVHKLASGLQKSFIVDANKRACELLEYTKEELTSISTNRIDSDKIWEETQVIPEVREEMKTKGFATFERILISKTGKLIPTEASSHIVKIKGEDLVMSIFRDISERQEAEKALKESEEKYRGFIENFDGIAFRGTVDFKAQFFHGAVRQITGYTEEDFIEKGLTWDKVIHPEDLHLTHAISFDLDNTPNFSDTMEYRIIRKDGDIRWIQQRVRNISDETGKPYLVQGTIHDVTEQKKIEKEIMESEEKFRLLFQNANDAIYLYGISDRGLPSNFIEVNDVAITMLGYSREEFLSMSPNSIAAPDTQKRISEIMKEILKEERLTFDALHVSKEGKEIPVEISSQILILDGRKMILSIVRDISERLQAIEELQKSENLYKTIFEAVGTANAIVSSEGIVKMVNTNITKLLGYEKEELEGKEWFNIMAESEIPRLIEYQKLRAQDPNAVPSQYESKVKHKKGDIIDILVNIKVIPGTTDIIASIMDISEMKKTEQEIKESEILYRTIFEATGSANVIANENRIIEFVNTRVEELTGYSKEEIEGKMRWDEFIPDDELEKLSDFGRLRRDDPTHAPEMHESKFIDKDGNVKDILLNVDLIPGTKNVIVAISDISRIKESENLYRTVFETTGSANAIIKKDSIIQVVNSKMEKLTGYSKEELIGMNWKDSVPEDEVLRLGEINRLRLEDSSLAQKQYESKFTDKEGNVKEILLSMDDIPDTDTTIVALVDISPLKKAQEELKKSEDLYRTLFETTGTSNIIFDSEANIKRVNTKMEILTGYSKEEVEGKRKWIEFVHPDEVERLLEYNKKRLLDPDSVPNQYETRIVAKDGKVINVLISVNLITGTKDFIASQMDISERKETEEEIIQQKEELSEFAHLMAHDIRNSLSAIEGFVDLIEVKYDSTYVDTINKQLLYMRELLDRSIELAEAGRVIEKSDDVDLNELFEDCANMIIPEGITFTHDNLPKIRADKKKLSQIVKNLFENAVQHGKPNKIEVLFKETEKEAFIYIQNDGEKADPKIVQEAFEAIFSTKELKELHGLTIVNKLIEAHGWEICLEAEKDTTSFKIVIPK
jgi:PAS domain S-box-containing protein